MRPLFWSKIPAARLAGTVWTDLDDTGIELHEDELVELFARPDKKEKAKSPSASATKSSKPAKVVSLLSGKRQQNAGIALSSIRVEPSVVEDWLTRCSTKLTAPVLRTLLKLVPTKDEVQALNEHDKSTPESIKQIPPVDAFMLMLGDIPRVKQRIECLLMAAQFEEKYEDALSGVIEIMRAVRKLKQSQQIKQIMETILALGNYVNGSTSRGQCVGFKLDALTKIGNTRGNDGKTTLMMYLCRLLGDDQLDFVEVADAASEAAKLTLSQVDADFNALRKQTKQMASEVENASNAPPNSRAEEDGFLAAMKPVSAMATKKVSQLDEEKGKMLDAFSSLVKSYGEDPGKNGPEVFFALWSRFFSQIEEACAANDKLEREKAKAKSGGGGGGAGGSQKKKGPGGAAPNPMAAMMSQMKGALHKRGKK